MPLVVSDDRGSHNEGPYRVTARTVKREALTLAIDRRGLYEVLNLPPDLPLFDALFSVDQFRRRDLPAGLSADPERSSQLLKPQVVVLKAVPQTHYPPPLDPLENRPPG